MNALITSSLREANVTLLFNFPRQLMSGTERKMVEWIVGYINRYSQPPTLERFCDEFPGFVTVRSRDPLGDTYDKALVRKRNVFAREFLTRIQDDLKAGKDPLPMIEELHKDIRGGAADIVRYTKYDRSAYYRSPTSYPYEIELLDRYTGGMAKGDLIYLVGRLGTGKTSVAMWVLSKGIQRGRKFLMVSNENRADDIVAKIDSYLGGFNPLKKRTMNWSDDDKNRLATVSFIASHMEGEVYIPSKPVQNTEEVQNLIFTYRPDIVIIDGIYLLGSGKGDTHWEKITDVSRNLKQIAEGEGVPIIGIHQASRQAIGKHMEIDHIAYADALAQDADLVMGINAEDDGSLFIESLKNRWGEKQWGFFLKIHFNTMTVRVYDEKGLMI